MRVIIISAICVVSVLANIYLLTRPSEPEKTEKEVVVKTVTNEKVVTKEGPEKVVYLKAGDDKEPSQNSQSPDVADMLEFIDPSPQLGSSDMSKIFSEELRDDDWAYGVESKLSSALNKSGFADNYPLTHVDCKKSVCQFSFNIQNPENTEVVDSLREMTVALLSDGSVSGFEIATNNDLEGGDIQVFLIDRERYTEK